MCFSVETAAHPLPESDQAVGIDVGLSSFATLSDGTEIESPRLYQQAQKKLRRAQRRVARRKKGSNRRHKAVVLLRKIHQHIFNQRHDHQHKLARMLVNQYGLIAIEDLNVRGLAGGMLSKQVLDASWSSFIAKLTYKAEDAGRQLVKVDPRGTSQRCPCGAKVPKKLSDRDRSSSGSRHSPVRPVSPSGRALLLAALWSKLDSRAIGTYFTTSAGRRDQLKNASDKRSAFFPLLFPPRVLRMGHKVAEWELYRTASFTRHEDTR